MQIKVSMVPDPSAVEGAPEMRVVVAIKDGKGMSTGEPDTIAADEGDVTIDIPEGGTVTLTAEPPPLVYDKDQMAAVPGEWPKEEEPAPAQAKAGPKSAHTTTTGPQGGKTETTRSYTPPPHK